MDWDDGSPLLTLNPEDVTFVPDASDGSLEFRVPSHEYVNGGTYLISVNMSNLVSSIVGLIYRHKVSRTSFFALLLRRANTKNRPDTDD